MFDARIILECINNRRYDTAQEFRDDLSIAISPHLAKLPPEIGTIEIARLVQCNNWLRKDGEKLLFAIPPMENSR
jgi:hypothetical protein